MATTLSSIRSWPPWAYKKIGVFLLERYRQIKYLNLKIFIDCDDKLILELLEKKEIDGLFNLAEIFPTRVFPEAVGLQKIDKETLLGYGAMVFNALGSDNEFRKDAMA